MKTQTCTLVSHTATFPSLAGSPHDYSEDDCSDDGRCMGLKRLTVLAMALLSVLLVQEKLFAQQANDQYATDQQSGYAAPDSAQPQPYGDQDSPPHAYPEPRQTDPQQGLGQVRPLNEQDLEQLVAPIALYPDALLAQVLTSSTYPDQVVDADRWRRTQGYASSDQIAERADAQPWDPSVKALTAFPQVLAQMDQNLHWTSELGNAYYNQPRDLLAAVQIMRRRARAAGNLQSTPQEAVNFDQGNIVLAPVNPQVVYVRAYNPWAVYGESITPYPGFSLLGALGSLLGSSAIRFGWGIAMTAFSHTPWGWLGWGLSWLTQSVLFHDSNYYSHSTTVSDWGLPHGGPRAFSQRGAMATLSNRSYRTPGGNGGVGNRYSSVRSQAYGRTRDKDAYARNRSEERYARGYQTFGHGRSSPEAYNRFQSAAGRSQRYGSEDYRSSVYGRSPQGYRSWTDSSHDRSMRANGAPRGGDFGERNFRGFKSNGFKDSSGKRAHWGGFHFGGGHAPKSSGGGKSFSRAHSGGGGHFGGHGHSGGKHRG
jgi:uncharacterized protein DUF3300